MERERQQNDRTLVNGCRLGWGCACVRRYAGRRCELCGPGYVFYPACLPGAGYPPPCNTTQHNTTRTMVQQDGPNHLGLW